MNFEIEKKFSVGNFEDTLKELIKDFGDFKKETKKGFWFCTNYNGTENMLDITAPKFFKKDVIIIKDITETLMPEEDFQYLRLRIKNDENFIMTVKNKSLVNNIEKNNEYEFELDNEVFKRTAKYLSDSALIFYYNVKESWKFLFEDTSIELSKITDLKDSYLEMELTGSNDNELMSKLNFRLKKIEHYSIKEEPKSYLESFLRENSLTLKNVKLSQFSKKAGAVLKENL